MLRLLTVFALGLASLASSACFTMNADLPGTLRGDVANGDVERIGSISYETGHWFYLWGLVGAPPRDVFAAEISKQVRAKGGDGVANLRYEGEFGCIDIGIGGCTGGCIMPRTYRVTGDVVRIKKAPLAGRPPKMSMLSSSTQTLAAVTTHQAY